MEVQVRYLALFLLFSVIDDFEWFWREILPKNIQLMLDLIKAPFLVLHFSYKKIHYFSRFINFVKFLSDEYSKVGTKIPIYCLGDIKLIKAEKNN